MYRFVDAAVVRAAACWLGTDFPPWPDLTGDTDEQVVAFGVDCNVFLMTWVREETSTTGTPRACWAAWPAPAA